MPVRDPGAFSLVEVTPEQAQVWLDGARSKYRSRRVIDSYREDFLQGSWNPERSHTHPVRVYNGQLYDGHHRLTAVVEAGIPVPIWTDVRTES